MSDLVSPKRFFEILGEFDWLNDLVSGVLLNEGLDSFNDFLSVSFFLVLVVVFDSEGLFGVKQFVPVNVFLVEILAEGLGGCIDFDLISFSFLVEF